MRAPLRRRPGGAARSVVFDGCSARVVGFLRLPDALEGVRGSSEVGFDSGVEAFRIKTVTRTSTNKEV